MLEPGRRSAPLAASCRANQHPSGAYPLAPPRSLDDRTAEWSGSASLLRARGLASAAEAGSCGCAGGLCECGGTEGGCGCHETPETVVGQDPRWRVPLVSYLEAPSPPKAKRLGRTASTQRSSKPAKGPVTPVTSASTYLMCMNCSGEGSLNEVMAKQCGTGCILQVEGCEYDPSKFVPCRCYFRCLPDGEGEDNGCTGDLLTATAAACSGASNVHVGDPVLDEDEDVDDEDGDELGVMPWVSGIALDLGSGGVAGGCSIRVGVKPPGQLPGP
jgi:hypothetical protein